MSDWSFQSDLDAMVAALEADRSKLAGKRIFMTGGTGFIGRWMLEALAQADRRLALGVSVTIVTRRPDAFADKAPHLTSYPAFNFVAGDVLTLEPDGQRYDFVIHAATDASADLNEHDPRRMFDTIVTGTRRALDFALAV
ncbi:MAG TPA: NAD-dependent epimerase/dehydratase family protein, partial [Sphingomicrobium sp.]